MPIKLSVCYREKTLNVLEIVNSLDEDRPTSHRERENRPSHLTPSKTSGTTLNHLAKPLGGIFFDSFYENSLKQVWRNTEYV